MQQLELMQENKESLLGSEPNHNEIMTIDDAIEKARELAIILSELGERRHPLDIRKGVENMEDKSERSKTLKAGAKTYFFDIKETKEGKPFLVITESRFKGEGEDRERSAIIVFQENAKEFSSIVYEMAKKLG